MRMIMKAPPAFFLLASDGAYLKVTPNSVETFVVAILFIQMLIPAKKHKQVSDIYFLVVQMRGSCT